MAASRPGHDRAERSPRPGGARRAGLPDHAQAGLALADLASEPEGLEDGAQVDYFLGGSLRSGARPFIQPGIYYRRTTISATGCDEIDETTFEDDLAVSSLWIPLRVRINIINGDAPDLDVDGGRTATVGPSVADNELGPVKVDHESVAWDAVGGAGVGLTLLGFDASYEFGLSKALKADPEDVKYDVSRVADGQRF